MTARRTDDRGAITIVAALAILVLATGGAWVADAGALTIVGRETDRTADLAALASAANLPLTGALSAGEPAATACATAGRLAGDVSRTLATSGAAPVCGAGVDIDDLTEWDTVETVRDALSSWRASLGLDVPDLCVPLVRSLLDPWLTTLTDAECAAVRDAVDALPARLSPAAVTPLVRVRVTGTYTAPLRLPGLGGARAVTATAVARRRFKNAVVLPAAPSGAPAGLDGIDPNTTAAEMRDVLLPLLRDAVAALRDAAAPHMPPGTSLDLSGLVRDVEDLYDPPAAAPRPSVADVVTEAVRTGDPVVVLRLMRMPVAGIPVLDFTAAHLARAADGTITATPLPAEELAAARGVFGATLVRSDP